MKRRITAAAIAGTLILALTACTSAAPDEKPEPEPSFSSVPTSSPTPVAGVDTPLRSTVELQLGYPVHFAVYDVKAWEAEKGCDCSAPGDEATELYPAGSTAWAVRIELITPPWTFGDGVDMQGVQLTSSWGPGAPLPVVAEEGEKLAEQLDLGWGFASAQSPALLEWDQKRSFLTTVYVPRGAVTLELEMEVPPIPGQHNAQTISYGLDVDLPQSVIDVMYANSNGD